VSENRLLRRIFGPEREEVAGCRRRLHNEELHNLYASVNNIRVIKSRMMRWARHVSRIREMRNADNAFKPEGRRPVGRVRGRWEGNITKDLREIG